MALTRENLEGVARKSRNPIIRDVISKNTDHYINVFQNINNGHIIDDLFFRIVIDDPKSLELIKEEVVENRKIGFEESLNDAFRDLILGIMRS